MPNAHKIIQNFFSDKFSPELTMKVWSWLVDSPNQTEKEAALMHLWNEAAFETDESTMGSYRNFRKRVEEQSHKKRPFYAIPKFARVAAVLLLPLLSIWVLYLYTQTTDEPAELVEYFVPKGAQEQLTLPDGTIACLNSGTLLIYPKKFSGDFRSVYLIGEGNFDVAKDKKHPFIVKTRKLRVRALGTKFNVLAYAEDQKTITTLESGSVLIQKETEEDIITLMPNEQLEYDNPTGDFNKRVINALTTSGWTKGELNFVAQPLKDIFSTLERKYDTHIIVPPQLMVSDIYTIKFRDKGNIEDIMKIIAQTVGNIHYVIEKDYVLLIYSPQNKKGGK